MLDSSSWSAYSGNPVTGFADLPYQWSAGAFAWPHFYDMSRYGKEAHQHLRVENVAMQDTAAMQALQPEFPLDYAGFYWTPQAEVEVPVQIEMDAAAAAQAETSDEAEAQRCPAETANAGTLRRRRGQERPALASYGVASDLPSVDEQKAEQHGDFDNMKARELANGLLVQMQAGGKAHLAVVQSFERLAFEGKVSCLAAQMLLEEASTNDKVALATGLRGHVRSAVLSKHANHVLQKITGVMTVSQADFIVHELKGWAHHFVRHIFGCRVMLRILEHLSPSDSSTIELVDEVCNEDMQELCNHVYGTHVMRHLLEFGLPEHKQRVVSALRSDLVGFTKNKNGSHVVEAALQHSSLEDRQSLARELLKDQEQLVSLAANQYGRHVVKALLNLPGDLKQEVLGVLRPMRDQLKASRFGKSVFAKMPTETSV
jgi:hypothetical protein